MVLQKAREFKHCEDTKVVFNFNDIASEAESLLVSASRKAEGVIAQAKKDGLVVLDESKSQGHQEGFQQGQKEGKQQGYDQALQQAREEFLAMNQQALTSLQTTLNEFDQVKHDIICRAERDTVSLAVAIAKKVIKKASLISSEVALENVKSALSFVAQPTNMLVKVNGEDLECLEKLAKQDTDVLGRFQSIRFETDESIEQGGCVVVTDNGEIDGQLDVQIDRIAQELLITV